MKTEFYFAIVLVVLFIIWGIRRDIRERKFGKNYPVGAIGILYVTKWENGFLFGNFYTGSHWIETVPVALFLDNYPGKINSTLVKVVENNGKTIRVELCVEALEVNVKETLAQGYEASFKLIDSTVHVIVQMLHLDEIKVGDNIIARYKPFKESGQGVLGFEYAQ